MTQENLKAAEFLKQIGIEPDSYPADACFSPNVIGTFSKDRETVCILIEDNEVVTDSDAILTKETIREIAYTCKRLITNMGCGVHSTTMKNFYPFNQLKIEKTSTFNQ